MGCWQVRSRVNVFAAAIGATMAEQQQAARHKEKTLAEWDRVLKEHNQIKIGHWNEKLRPALAYDAVCQQVSVSRGT